MHWSLQGSLIDGALRASDSTHSPLKTYSRRQAPPVFSDRSPMSALRAFLPVKLMRIITAPWLTLSLSTAVESRSFGL